MRPLFAAIILLGTAAFASADDTIWSGVIVASNVAQPKPAPAELRDFERPLKRIFGYNQFQILGTASQAIDEAVESWVVPTPNFWFGVKARRTTSKEAQGGYLLDLKLYQDKRPLVDTAARLAPSSPLFIRGPQCSGGQLIIVLQIKQ